MQDLQTRAGQPLRRDAFLAEPAETRLPAHDWSQLERQDLRVIRR